VCDHRRSAEEIVLHFCSSEPVLKLATPPKRRRAGAAGNNNNNKRARGAGRASARGSADAPSMDEMLRKYDVDGSISTLIEMERERPEAMLEAEQLEQV